MYTCCTPVVHLLYTRACPPLLPRRSPQAAATARRLWGDMQADGVQPNGMAIAAFLEILLLEGEVDEALQVGGRAGTGAALAWRPLARVCPGERPSHLLPSLCYLCMCMWCTPG